MSNYVAGILSGEGLEVTAVSDLAMQVKVPQYAPLSDAQLHRLIEIGRYGIALHQSLGIADNEKALPVNIQPYIWLSMVQEIARSRANAKT